MVHTALNEDEQDYNTDMPLGEILRRAREHYGQSLADIERALRIRAEQIQAIETGNIENLPGRVYAIGFVRSYSEYLGLDGDRMVHLFKTQTAGAASDPQLTFPVAASESKVPSIPVVIVSCIVSILILSGWWMFQNRDRELVQEIPPVPLSMRAEVADGKGEVFGPYLPTEEMAIIEAPPPEGIILNITHNSWVEIRDASGKALISQVLNAGDQYFVPDAPGLVMSLGNAGGVSLEVDGQPLSPIGNLGDVRRSIALDAESLKKNYATPE